MNCRAGVLPAEDAPPEEAFRDACKLYVATKRARRELIVSFHDAASPWLLAVSDSISSDRWDAYEALEPEFIIPPPARLPEHERPDATEWDLPGSAFLYTAGAFGLTADAQAKLAELVDGIGLRSGQSGRRLRWRTVQGLVRDLTSSRTYDLLIGPKVAQELRSRLQPPAAPGPARP